MPCKSAVIGLQSLPKPGDGGACLVPDIRRVRERTGNPVDHWNFRGVISGGIDHDRIGALLDQPTADGWQSTGANTFSKMIQPGVVAQLVVTAGSDSVQLLANASGGLTCA